MKGLAGLKEELEDLRQAGLWRRLRRIESLPGPRVTVEGREFIMCASNNYLALAGDPRLSRAAAEALERYGAGSTGSRLITGNTALHEALEERIARWKGTEAALVFATGYMANVALASTLAGRGDVIFSDEWNHASIIDGCRLSRAEVRIYRHADVGDLERQLAGASGARRRVIITDGVFSMDGDVAPLPDILELAARYDACVVVDDAHAGGVLGERGRGTAEYFGLDEDGARGGDRPPLVQMGTLSKAAGVEGAYVAASREIIEYLRNRARPFIFSTAPSPATVGAALKAVELMEREKWRRDRLRELAARLRDGLRRQGWTVPEGPTPIIPVITGGIEKTLEVAKRLEEEGIYAPAIRPPTVPPEACRIRITVTAAHGEEELSRILEAFARCR